MRFSMSNSSAPSHLQPAIGSRSGNRALSVMDQIREAILGGSIRAGERLNEVRLSKTLAVSRTPVRAALQALAGGRGLEASPHDLNPRVGRLLQPVRSTFSTTAAPAK